jgi:hypothetical protein
MKQGTMTMLLFTATMMRVKDTRVWEEEAAEAEIGTN